MEIKTIISFLSVMLGMYLLIFFIPNVLWIYAQCAGVKISLSHIIKMCLRRAPILTIISAKKKCNKAGINIKSHELEAHYHAGGNVHKVVDNLIWAIKEGINLDFMTVTAIDLAGLDLLEAIQMMENSKATDTNRVSE